MTGERTVARRAKYVTLLGIVLVAATGLAASTQNWFHLAIVNSTGDSVQIDVAGTVAAPALTALSLSSLALAGALAIAGPVLRLVLGVLQLLIAVSVGLSASTALADPVRVSGSLITGATGIAGSESVAALVDDVQSTAWPVVTVVVAVGIAATAVAVLVTARRWPGSASKKTSRFEVATSPAESYGAGTSSAMTEDGEIDPVVTWDELSRGDDPTRRGGGGGTDH